MVYSVLSIAAAVCVSCMPKARASTLVQARLKIALRWPSQNALGSRADAEGESSCMEAGQGLDVSRMET